MIMSNEYTLSNQEYTIFYWVSILIIMNFGKSGPSNTPRDNSLQAWLLQLGITQQNVKAHLEEIHKCISEINADTLSWEQHISIHSGGIEQFVRLILQAITNTNTTSSMMLSQQNDDPHQPNISLDWLLEYYEKRLTELDTDAKKKYRMLLLIGAFLRIKSTGLRQKKIDELIEALNNNQKERDRLFETMQDDYNHLVEQIVQILKESDGSL